MVELASLRDQLQELTPDLVVKGGMMHRVSKLVKAETPHVISPFQDDLGVRTGIDDLVNRRVKPVQSFRAGARELRKAYFVLLLLLRVLSMEGR